MAKSRVNTNVGKSSYSKQLTHRNKFKKESAAESKQRDKEESDYLKGANFDPMKW
jgi:GTP-binding protein EngB required for normal cell division